MKQHSATGHCILGLAVTVTFPRNLVGFTRDRKSAVFWNASKNIGILSLQMTLRALFFLYRVGGCALCGEICCVGWLVSEEGTLSDLDLITETKK